MAELTLQWQVGGQSREAHVTDEAAAVLGRSADATVCIDPNNRAISRHHAQIQRRTEGFAISNISDGGRNPVNVNGRTINAETPLKEGDSIQLGNVTLRVTTIQGIAPPAGGATMKLRWEVGGRAHDETVRAGDSVVIGRDASVAIVIPSQTVSRQHARITEKGGGFVITNLRGDENPITVNQRPLTEERYLSPGDVIKLGDATVVVTAVQRSQPQYGISELRQGRLVVCSNCHREVDGSYQDCPWCGTALVNAETVLPRY